MPYGLLAQGGMPPLDWSRRSPLGAKPTPTGLPLSAPKGMTRRRTPGPPQSPPQMPSGGSGGGFGALSPLNQAFASVPPEGVSAAGSSAPMMGAPPTINTVQRRDQPPAGPVFQPANAVNGYYSGTQPMPTRTLLGEDAQYKRTMAGNPYQPTPIGSSPLQNYPTFGSAYTATPPGMRAVTPNYGQTPAQAAEEFAALLPAAQAEQQARIPQMRGFQSSVPASNRVTNGVTGTYTTSGNLGPSNRRLQVSTAADGQVQITGNTPAGTPGMTPISRAQADLRKSNRTISRSAASGLNSRLPAVQDAYQVGNQARQKLGLEPIALPGQKKSSVASNLSGVSPAGQTGGSGQNVLAASAQKNSDALNKALGVDIYTAPVRDVITAIEKSGSLLPAQAEKAVQEALQQRLQDNDTNFINRNSIGGTSMFEPDIQEYIRGGHKGFAKYRQGGRWDSVRQYAPALTDFTQIIRGR